MSAAGLRFLCRRTVSGKPLATRFLAMPWPISPRPTKPIRGLSVLMIILSGNTFGATGRLVARHQPRTEGTHLRRRSGRQFIDLVLSQESLVFYLSRPPPA